MEETTATEATEASTPTLATAAQQRKAPSPEEARAPATPRLRRCQELSARKASSFVPDAFNPVPFLTNCHLQTIAGVFLRTEPDCAYATSSGSEVLQAVARVRSLNAQTNGKTAEEECDFWDRRERIGTPDDDYFHVDYKNVDEARHESGGSRGTVVLLHGLESSSNSSLSVDLATSYVQRGFDVACLNFRGCCGGPEPTPGAYHLGFTDDLCLFLDVLTNRRCKQNKRGEGDDAKGGIKPLPPVYLSGFSLGANVVLKCLGELGEAAVDRHCIAGAAVTGAPFNNELNNKKVEAPGFNKLVYSENFLTSMKKRLRQKVEEECVIDPAAPPAEGGGFDYERCMLANSIAEFETEYISPVYGYENNVDYYRKTSCQYFLESIAVPTLILNAADDPFFDPACFPVKKGREAGGPAPIKFVRTEHGGHLGYMFHQPVVDGKSLPPQRRPRQKVTGDSANSNSIERQTSWMPSELARFIDHVDVHPTNSV